MRSIKITPGSPFSQATRPINSKTFLAFNFPSDFLVSGLIKSYPSPGCLAAKSSFNSWMLFSKLFILSPKLARLCKIFCISAMSLSIWSFCGDKPSGANSASFSTCCINPSVRATERLKLVTVNSELLIIIQRKISG